MARHDLSDLSDADLARLPGAKGRHGDTMVAHISPEEAGLAQPADGALLESGGARRRVEDGRLYLRSQTSQAFQPFDVRVDSMHWNAAMLTELVRQHPELRALLPDPNAPGGGIRWLHPSPGRDAPKP